MDKPREHTKEDYLRVYIEGEVGQVLENLEEQLRNLYPPHHHKHIEVWGKYWGLFESIIED